MSTIELKSSRQNERNNYAPAGSTCYESESPFHSIICSHGLFRNWRVKKELTRSQKENKFMDRWCVGFHSVIESISLCTNNDHDTDQGTCRWVPLSYQRPTRHFVCRAQGIGNKADPAVCRIFFLLVFVSQGSPKTKLCLVFTCVETAVHAEHFVVRAN